ncbi:MAG: EAL domain-containing protein [Rhodobacteraceae bacterium]|nr:EAL domain-containing protein [Paracoccaceae bacterium]
MRSVSEKEVAKLEVILPDNGKAKPVLSALLDVLPVPAMAIAADCSLLSFNHRMPNLVQAVKDATHDLEHMVRSEISALFDPKSWQRCQYAIQAALSGTSIEVEGGLYWRDGTRCCDLLSISSVPLERDADAVLLLQFKTHVPKAGISLLDERALRHFPDDAVLLSIEAGEEAWIRELEDVGECIIDDDRLRECFSSSRNGERTVLYARPRNLQLQDDAAGLGNEIRFCPITDEQLACSHVMAIIRRGVEDPSISAQNRELAYRDPLTGLPNRRAFLKTLAAHGKSIQSGVSGLAVFCIDLDDFKRINDLGGHATGDEMLRLVASNLQHSLDGKGLFARMGGDEFAAVCEVESQDEARDYAAQMCENLDQIRLHQDERTFSIGGSVGICFCAPETLVVEPDLTKLLHEADIASMKAKGQQGSVFNIRQLTLSDDEKAKEEAAGVRSETDTRELPMKAFRLHAMPIVSLKTGKKLGSEVLLKLREQNAEAMTPRALVTAVERSGCMSKVDGWTLDQVVALAEIGPRNQWYSVNVSLDAFSDPFVRELLESRLSDHPLLASRLCLEVSEKDVLREPAGARNFLKLVAGYGCEVQVDDFSGSWPVLDLISELNVKWVKLDPVCVQDTRTCKKRHRILGALLEACSQVGIHPIAKNIETDEQFQFIKDMGFFAAQGLYFGQPKPLGAD